MPCVLIFRSELSLLLVTKSIIMDCTTIADHYVGHAGSVIKGGSVKPVLTK